MKNHEFQELVDQNLSGLVWDERKRQRVLHAISEEEKPVRKISATFVLIAAIVCLSVTALATGLSFSPKYEVGKVADQALEQQYGITTELLSLFHRTIEENEDRTATVKYDAPAQDFPSVQMGTYFVEVIGNKATASWSNDGKDTSGGLFAEAFGPEQLMLLLHDYGNSMQVLYDAGMFVLKASASSSPNPRLQSEIEWTEVDQAVADRVNAEAEAENRKRLDEIAKAESMSKYSIQDVAKMAQDAIAREYDLTAAQLEKLEYEADVTTYISYQENHPVANLLFWMNQIDGQFTEKDGQYWVAVDMNTGIIDQITYDPGLAGNG